MFICIYLEAQEYKKNTLIGNQKTLFILQDQQQNFNKEYCINYQKNNKYQWIFKEQQKKCGFYESEQKIRKRYEFYGPNCVIYLGILSRLMLFMVFLSIFFGIPLIVVNSKGSFCKNDPVCYKKQFTYSVSLVNIMTDKEKLIVQVFLWLFASFFLSIFFIYLRVYILRVNQQIDNESITEGDYSIIIRRASLNISIDDIQKLINRDIKIEIMKKFSLSQGQADDQLKIQTILPLFKMDQYTQQLKVNSKNFKKSIGKNSNIQKIYIKLPHQFSGSLIIIFNKISVKDKIMSILKTRFQQQIIYNFFPFITPKTQFLLKDKGISIDHAPQPTDLIIQNIGYTLRQRLMYKIIFTSLVLFIICFSCIVSYFIQAAKQKLLTNKLVLDTNIAVYFSIIAFLFNRLISKFLEFSIKKQKLDTKTYLIRCGYVVTVFNQTVSLVLFSIIIPLFINSENVKQSLKNSKFPTAMIVLIVFKGIVSNTVSFLEEYFEITLKIKEWIFKKNIIKKTQVEAHEELKSQIDFSSKCADLTQLFWFSIIFGIISPICIFVACVGLLLWIIYDRILFLKRYSIPEYTSTMVLFTFVEKLELIVFFIGLLNMCTHLFTVYIEEIEMSSTIFAVSLVNLIYGAIFNLLPLNKILRKLGCGIAEKESKVDYQSQQFLKSYKKLHSSTWLDSIMYKVTSYNDKCGILYKIDSQRKLNPESSPDQDN